MALRHLISIAVLPGTVAVVVPVWIARASEVRPRLGATPGMVALQLLGALLLVVGLVFFVWSLGRFATEGEGTLAPWDPPRRLVVAGPYRLVRHPMISGVVFVVFGEAALLLSRPHLGWAITFLAINLIYIPLFEEPQLARRFGREYQEYRRHVPWLIPRLTPWRRDRSV
jgi:protein-S-isoprenylcysteine O-methyltransferase Ste14